MTTSSAPTARPLTATPLLVDTLIALGLTALSVVALVGGAGDAGGRDPLSVILLLAQTLPLAVRRRWPIPVLAVTLGATLLHAWLAQTASLPESLGSIVALFTVAELYDRRVSVGASIVVAVAYFTMIAAKVGIPVGLSGLIQTQLAVLGAFVLGTWARTRRRYASAVAETARLQSLAAETAAERAVQAERDRIARELHDIVSHHVSVMVIQAGAARTALDRRPDDARMALEAIERIGRQAMTDMRRMLGILGESGTSGAGATEAGLEPMPDLGRLGELVDEVRGAGMPVTLRIDGTPSPMDRGVGLSAYRIVQESLTNALKHASGARAEVVVRYGPRSVDLLITDEGGSARPDLAGRGGASGRGLVGMRERVALYGGTLEAGPTATGFRVAARLPVEASAGPSLDPVSS